MVAFFFAGELRERLQYEMQDVRNVASLSVAPGGGGGFGGGGGMGGGLDEDDVPGGGGRPGGRDAYKPMAEQGLLGGTAFRSDAAEAPPSVGLAGSALEPVAAPAASSSSSGDGGYSVTVPLAGGGTSSSSSNNDTSLALE